MTDAQPYSEEELAALWQHLDVLLNRYDACFPIEKVERLKATLAARDRRISELKAQLDRLRVSNGAVPPNT